MTRRERRKTKRTTSTSQPIIPIKVEKKEDKQDYTHRGNRGKFFNWYGKNLKKMMILPLIMVVFAIVMIIFQTATTGSFVNKGISLTGGQTITVTHEGLDATLVETTLRQEYPAADIGVRVLSEFGTQKGLIIESSLDAPLDGILQIMMQWVPDVKENYSVETIGSSLSEGFFREILIALLIAFIFMSIVVFVLFRTLWPSLAIIAAALGDMIFAVAIINLFGIKLSTAGIAALLMLIGYSVDTDILLTTRILRAKRGDFLERTKKAMATGLTMTGTALGVVIVGLIFAESDVLRQIFTILLIGLIADLPFTWIQNVTILKIYMDKKSKKSKG